MLLWWFALYQVSPNSPDWIARAQAVCFGKNESGLPDASGWITIALMPLSLLLALSFAMGDEIKNSLAGITKTKSGLVFLFTVLFTLCFESYWAGSQIIDGLELEQVSYASQTKESLPVHYTQLSIPAPSFSLINEAGEMTSLSEDNNKIKIVTFAFAHCRTVCPAIVASTRSAIERLPRENVELLIITLDPWRDTPGSLPSLAKRWKLPSNAHVLSGEIDEVEETIRRFNIPTVRDKKTGDINHPAIVYIISPDNLIRYSFNNPSPKWLMDAIERLSQAYGER